MKILSLERHDLDRRFQSAASTNPVALQATAVDQPLGLEFTNRGQRHDRRGALDDPHNLGAQANVRAAGLPQRQQYLSVVHDTGILDVKRSKSGHVRLETAQCVAFDHLGVDLVTGRLLGQPGQARKLLFTSGHDHLAAKLIIHVVITAKLQ
jgi:hypothetical protein